MARLSMKGQSRSIASDQDELCTVPRQFDRNGPAESRGRSGNQDPAALEIEKRSVRPVGGKVSGEGQVLLRRIGDRFVRSRMVADRDGKNALVDDLGAGNEPSPCIQGGACK